MALSSPLFSRPEVCSKEPSPGGLSVPGCPRVPTTTRSCPRGKASSPVSRTGRTRKAGASSSRPTGASSTPSPVARDSRIPRPRTSPRKPCWSSPSRCPGSATTDRAARSRPGSTRSYADVSRAIGASSVPTPSPGPRRPRQKVTTVRIPATPPPRSRGLGVRGGLADGMGTEPPRRRAAPRPGEGQSPSVPALQPLGPQAGPDLHDPRTLRGQPRPGVPGQASRRTPPQAGAGPAAGGDRRRLTPSARRSRGPEVRIGVRHRLEPTCPR